MYKLISIMIASVFVISSATAAPYTKSGGYSTTPAYKPFRYNANRHTVSYDISAEDLQKRSSTMYHRKGIVKQGKYRFFRHKSSYRPTVSYDISPEDLQSNANDSQQKNIVKQGKYKFFRHR